jgi:hypothetical protein
VEWETIHTVQDYLQWLSTARDVPYRRSLDRARRQVADIDPEDAARRSGATRKSLDDGSGRSVLILPFLGRNHVIGHPGFRIVDAETGQEPSVFRQVIMLHYLKAVDDSCVPIGFVSIGGLAHGRPYERPLQKSALEPLARAYAGNLGHLRLAAQALGGRPLQVKNSDSIAFSFWPLPRLPMGIALAPGDEELPARAKLLVDVNTECWLPIYDTVIVGRLLCQTLLRLKPVGGRVVRLSAALAEQDGALFGASF